jgi:hypothetical protein
MLNRRPYPSLVQGNAGALREMELVRLIPMGLSLHLENVAVVVVL